MNIKIISNLALAGLIVTGSIAQVQKFTVGNAGGMKVSQVFTFDNDAEFENFTGQTHKVSGSINFDPAHARGSGRIAVDLSSIDTGIALRNEHLRGGMWLNTDKFPEAVFETTSVKHGTGAKYLVAGKLTLHGITRAISADATVRYVKESDATRRAMFMGNVVNVKTSFKVDLADYGIMIPDMVKGKVANTITVHLNVFGYTG